MFFIAGVYPKRVELDYYKPILCNSCSQYGRYEVFMEYSTLSIFFIPLFKFNKKYYVRTSCCNSLYLIINREKALMIEKGQGGTVSLNDGDVQLLQKGISYNKLNCNNCGNEITGEYNYCPNCGSKV